MKFKRKLKGAVTLCFAYCRQKKKLTRMLALFTATVLILGGLTQYSKAGLYVKDEEGRLIALRGDGEKGAGSLLLEVEAEKDGRRIAEEVILSMGGNRESPGRQRVKTAEELLRETVADTVRSLSQHDGERIRLPQKLKDGTRLTWHRQRNYNLLLLIFVPPMGLYFAYRTEKEKLAKAEKMRKAQILRRLPGFNNQLLLLIGSGLIFHDAFYRISASSLRKQKKDAMDELLLAVRTLAEESGVSVIKAFAEAAGKLKIRELTRMVNIISDNQYKGVNLTEKLAAESDLLWDLRKKNAQESGRIAETKLTFPLALLLLVLVMITAAPAILEM